MLSLYPLHERDFSSCDTKAQPERTLLWIVNWHWLYKVTRFPFGHYTHWKCHEPRFTHIAGTQKQTQYKSSGTMYRFIGLTEKIRNNEGRQRSNLTSRKSGTEMPWENVIGTVGRTRVRQWDWRGGCPWEKIQGGRDGNWRYSLAYKQAGGRLQTLDGDH